jgi:Zn-dependent protease with chaperone function
MQINTVALVTKKEKIYFRILLGANISFWAGSFLCLFGPFKLPIIFIYLYFLFTFLLAFLGQGLYMGYLKNSAIKVSEKQLPGVLRTVKNLSAKIGLEKIPDIFIIESGGLLNAFATKFLLGSRNFVFIYSDILELAF